VGAAPPVTCFEFFELPETIHHGDRIQLGTNVSFEGHFAQGLRMGVWAEPSAKLKAMSQRLVDMQDAALATLRVGAPVHTLADTLERMIDETCPFTADTDPFRFQSCHQLGLDYSEPWLATALDRRRDRAGDKDGPVFREGMVFEIHPNFTVPGLGHVCQGDMAMVTAAGAEWITTYPRGLVVLPG
jgi:Xaa-Pro aminopeptidase